jgi:hypothetical protein
MTDWAAHWFLLHKRSASTSLDSKVAIVLWLLMTVLLRMISDQLAPQAETKVHIYAWFMDNPITGRSDNIISFIREARIIPSS